MEFNLSKIFNVKSNIEKKYGICFDDLAIMITLDVSRRKSTKSIISDLISKEIAVFDESLNKVILTDRGENIISDIFSNKQKVHDSKNILELANAMREMFPKGKKPGTNKYWRDNQNAVASKLESLFKKYGLIDFELILAATKKYVDSYVNDNTTMRIVSYFILKYDNSDLMSIIENFDADDDPVDQDWRTTLI